MLCPRLFRISASLLFCLLVVSCGSNFSEPLTSGGTSQGGEPSTEVAPGTQVFGRLVTRPAMAVTSEEVWPFLVAGHEALLARGMDITEGGQLLLWPEAPGSQWRIKVGDQVFETQADGSFHLSVPDSGAQTFLLCHPTDDSYGETEVSFSSLSTNPEVPQKLVLSMVFPGPCGMGLTDETDFCGEAGVSGRYIPPDFVPGGTSQDDKFWGVRRLRLGTYPPPESHLVATSGLSCPRYDGPLTIADVPAVVLGKLTEAEVGDLENQISYVGSTCDLAVLDGTCPNENPMSDIEYVNFAKSIFGGVSYDRKEAQARVIGLLHAHYDSKGFGSDGPPLYLVPPSLATINATTETSCLKNHKGRMCGMFEAGDVAVDADGTVIRAGQSDTVRVAPGQQGTLIVHNNGAFGVTSIFVGEGLAVELSAPDLSRREGGQHTLFHYDDDKTIPRKPYVYQTDRELSFQIPENAQAGDRVTLTFTVDQNSLQVTFIVSDFEITPQSVDLNLTETQDFQVEFDGEKPENAVYEWSLQRDTGFLTRPGDDSSVITYTPKDNASGSDVLTVKVSTVNSETLENVELGTAEAQINLREGKVTITPTSTKLRPSRQQTFTAELDPVPDGTIEYFWSLVGTTGTLASPTSSETIYTASFSVEPPATDTLELVVRVTDGDGNTREYGTASAQIDILEGEATISPGAPRLFTGSEEGESQGFTVAVTGDTAGKTLTYQWESLNGYGTITNPDQRTITYHVNTGLTPPLFDRLRVTVYGQEGMEAPQEFAQATIDVGIDQLIFYVEMGADSWKTDGATYFNGGAWAVYDVEPIANAINYRITVVEQSFDAIPSYIGASSFFRADDPNALTNGVYRHISGRGSVSTLSAASRDAWVAARLAFYESQTGRARVVVNFELEP